MNILIFNWHEAYIHSLAKTGYRFDVVETWKGNRFGWIREFRPVPLNCRLINKDSAEEGLRTGRYDRVISQNADDLLFVYKYNVPVIHLFHTKFSYLTTLLADDEKNSFREKLKDVLDLMKRITLVFVSPAKQKDWGFGGEVIPPGIDPGEYGNYQGDIAKALRVGNGLTGGSMDHMRKEFLGDIPCSVIGDSPEMSESYLPSSWDEYKNYLRNYRVYLSMLPDKEDDGYNFSMLEAMATGMPVVSIANSSSPIVDGVNGYISDDGEYLRERLKELLQNRSLAETLGRRARETVINEFPFETFINSWKRVIEGGGIKKASIFEKNLSVLRETNPGLAGSLIDQGKGADLKITEAKSGMPSLKANRIALHSLYDPVKETREWAAHHEKEIQGASSVFILGFGLGYHVMEACKSPGREITVFEPRLDVLRTAMETFCLTPALSRVRIVTDDKIPPFDRGTVILQHTPSVNANREYFGRLLSRLKARERIQEGLKILVVGPVYGGSLPIARYCSGTLKKMGHSVELIDNSRFEDALFYAKGITKDEMTYGRLTDRLTEFLSEAVLARCEVFKPDLVLALAQAPLTPECLRRIRESGIPTAFWFVEDFRLMNYWRSIAGYYDYFFTIQQEGFFEELRKAGIRNFHYLPLAADPCVHKKKTGATEEEKRYYGSDVSFVGAGYYNRRHLFKGLLDYDFKIWGTDWDMNSALARCVQRSGGRVDTEETVLIFNASRININLHSSTYHRGINPFGDFVNPRTFEIAACGGFQLTDRRSGLKGLFREGEEIVLFGDLEDLRKKIEYYLENPEERCRVAEKARQRVLREHTYENRMQDMLGFLADRGFQPVTGGGEGEIVTELIAEAAGDGGLTEYLSRFSGKARITLPDIVKDIETSEGDLTKSETLFLAMNEFLK